MQFLVIAKDHPDALDRRMAAREEHLKKVGEACERGEEIVGAALQDNDGRMCGSMLLFDVESRARVDELIANDPYTKNNVWGSIEVTACKVAPVFAHLLKVKGN